MSSKKENLDELIVLEKTENDRHHLSESERDILYKKNLVKFLNPKVIIIFLIYLLLILTFMILPIIMALIFNDI